MRAILGLGGERAGCGGPAAQGQETETGPGGAGTGTLSVPGCACEKAHVPEESGGGGRL